MMSMTMCMMMSTSMMTSIIMRKEQSEDQTWALVSLSISMRIMVSITISMMTSICLIMSKEHARGDHHNQRIKHGHWLV